MDYQDCYVLQEREPFNLIRLPLTQWKSFSPYDWCLWKENPTSQVWNGYLQEYVEIPVHDPLNLIPAYPANFATRVVLINLAHRIIDSSDFIIKEVATPTGDVVEYRYAARYIIASISYTPDYATCESSTVRCDARPDLDPSVYDVAWRVTFKPIPINIGTDSCLLDESTRKEDPNKCPKYDCEHALLDLCINWAQWKPEAIKPVLLWKLVPIFVPGTVLCRGEFYPTFPGGYFLTRIDDEISAWIYKEDNPFYIYAGDELSGYAIGTYTSFESRDVLVMLSGKTIVASIDGDRGKALLKLLGDRQLYYPPEMTETIIKCMTDTFHYVSRMRGLGYICEERED